MGYTTDFVGYVSVDPPLNVAECEYLEAFSQTRRWLRPEGRYVVLDNPYVDEVHDDVNRYNRPWPGEPGLWCPWRPCLDGRDITWDGIEKPYAPVEWMRDLINHFLKPGAAALSSGLACFSEFTFDHWVDGTLVGCRRDTGRLFAIEVRANRVRERTLMAGIDESSLWGPLPYQSSIDDARPKRRKHRAP
jgi:hypothetical protein